MLERTKSVVPGFPAKGNSIEATGVYPNGGCGGIVLGIRATGCCSVRSRFSTHESLRNGCRRVGPGLFRLKAEAAVSTQTLTWFGNRLAECSCRTHAEGSMRPYPSINQVRPFTFVDLFAGIGGMRLGFEAAGGRCIFTSEWNSWSQQTYRANFGADEGIAGDITQLRAERIPRHDVLLAGFPCQPFSIAGVSKKNALNRPHGFACITQGTLFFDVARILEAKRPRAFLLENVKNLVSHDGGRTFATIRAVLEDELGYQVHTRVLDARSFVPQHRERILIVGFREPSSFGFDGLDLPAMGPALASLLHPEDGSEQAEAPYTYGPKASVSAKYTLSEKLWLYLQGYAEKHRRAGNGFGFGLVNGGSVTRTLSARYYKDGSEILVDQGTGRSPRRLTPRECARLMGFPKEFRIPVSDTQAYRQFGNSVAVPMIAAVARQMAATF